MTESVWHFLEDGEQKGPVAAPELAAMIRGGRLTADSLVWTSEAFAYPPHQELFLMAHVNSCRWIYRSERNSYLPGYPNKDL